MKKFYNFAALIAVILLLAFNVIAQESHDERPAVPEQDAFRAAVQTRGNDRLAALKKFTTDFPKSAFTPLAKIEIAKYLIDKGSEEKEYLPIIEEALKDINPARRPLVLNDVAYALAEASKSLDTAISYATKALDAVSQESPDFRAQIQDTLGWAQFKKGNTAEAIKNLEAAVKVVEDATLFEHLGRAYDKDGQLDKAIDIYINAAAITDKAERGNLIELIKAAYAKKKETVDVEARINSRATELLNKHALVDAKYEQDAPNWELKDLSTDKPVHFNDLKGKVVVLDWWGSWCPPCRQELPHFQKLYESYKDKGVVFVGMNWEQPDKSIEERLGLAKKFMAQKGYNFPVVADPELSAGNNYKVDGFPTVFVIDRQGKIRYRMIGYSPDTPELMEIQIKTELARETK